MILYKIDNDAKIFNDWLQRDVVVPTGLISENIGILEGALNGWLTEYGPTDETMKIQQEIHRYQQLLARAGESYIKRVDYSIRLGGFETSGGEDWGQ